MTNNVDFLPINISIVTISDTRNLENDKSGDVLVQRVKILAIRFYHAK